MSINKTIKMIALAGIGLAAGLNGAHAAEALKINFSNDTVGAESTSFLNVVGVWRIEAEGNHKGVGGRLPAMERGADVSGSGRQGAGNLVASVRQFARIR